MKPAMNPTIATSPPATWTLVAPLVVVVADAEAAEALFETDDAADEAESEAAAAARTEVVIVAWDELDSIVELETMEEEEEDVTAVVEFDEVAGVVEFPPETSMPVPHGMAAPVPG
jgi:hypothetical protein